MQCPLCSSLSTKSYHITPLPHQSHYYLCSDCFLIFTDPQYILEQSEEKGRYDQHHNDSKDEGYRKFLRTLTEPLNKLLAPNSYGLDFGCGPGPTLSLIMSELGHKTELYDPYYFPNEDILKNTFDFITSTEVFEHLSKPKLEIEKLMSALKPGGYLAIMTQFYFDNTDFASWWYKNDPTHICFYHHKTMEWIAEHYQLNIVLMTKNIVIYSY